jgi:hypothetical protein
LRIVNLGGHLGGGGVWVPELGKGGGERKIEKGAIRTTRHAVQKGLRNITEAGLGPTHYLNHYCTCLKFSSYDKNILVHIFESSI